jgi:hypothetical protein
VSKGIDLCRYAPINVGETFNGDLNGSDCIALSSRNTLIDYYEFKLPVTSDITISVDKGSPTLYARDGTAIVTCCGQTIKRNLTEGTYMIGVANNGTLNYTLSLSTP